MAYKESDLVLSVSKNVDPDVWDEGFYQNFMDILFKKRDYQKEATEIVLRYINSGEYQNLEDLARENFKKNHVIRERFSESFESMKNDIAMPNKLSATVDLATGTGKSYVMIAIALIMLSSKKVSRVLVLVPSLTIESELTQKFKDVLANDQLVKSLGSTFDPPIILNGDSTIVENSIAIENRNAIYSAQSKRNSIVDSLSGNGEKTLVLNDEVHHVYYQESNQWKEFIKDERENDINFKYVIGFTGTPYKSKTKTGVSNEYFSDVIYRYSLREAIEQNFVKDIHYIAKEDIPNDKNERWQVISNSHDRISRQLKDNFGEKPITIIVTAKQTRADSQAKSFKKFLKKQRGLTDDEVDNIVLSVHSGAKAAKDRLKLKNVDTPGNCVEFIFSVSMLTEGWDVKRVFQIVPDEERAFNSKLLIAQVLGRGLRRPNSWKSAWGTPTVTVFNHEKWSTNVTSLVDEILELRKILTARVDKESKYNFKLDNIKYKSNPIVKDVMKMGTYNLWEKGVNLPTDSEKAKSSITFVDVQNESSHDVELDYSHEVISIDEMANILYYRFEDLEDKENTIEYQSLWPISRITKMIEESLKNSSNKVITKNLKNKFLASLGPVFREGARSVSYDTIPSEYLVVDTKMLPNETSDLLNFKRNKTIFYSDKFESGLTDNASKVSFNELKDTVNGFFQKKIENKYHFKTPQFGIITNGTPEKDFLSRLTSKDVSITIDSFIKSPDMNFYSIDYTWRKGSHAKSSQFNPDWFIKQGDCIIVVETKDNSQINNIEPENVGKNKAAIKHFEYLNQLFHNGEISQQYKFVFLTPKNYDVFFEKLKSNEIYNFKSELDIALSN